MNEADPSVLLAAFLCVTRQHLNKSLLQNAHLHVWTL